MDRQCHQGKFWEQLACSITRLLGLRSVKSSLFSLCLLFSLISEQFPLLPFFWWVTEEKRNRLNTDGNEKSGSLSLLPQFLSRVHSLQIVFGKSCVGATNTPKIMWRQVLFPPLLSDWFYTPCRSDLGCVWAVWLPLLCYPVVFFTPCGYLPAGFVQGSGFGVPEKYLKPGRQMLSFFSPTRLCKTQWRSLPCVGLSDNPRMK